MKIVLVAVNARFSHSNPALDSIYYYAKEQLPTALFARLEIKRAEFNINQVEEEAAAALFAERGDIYAFSVYIWNALFTDRLLARLHGMLPGALFVAGGPEVEYDAEHEYERQPLWSYVCTGEGETEYLPIFRALAEGRPPAETLAQRRALQQSGQRLTKRNSVIDDIPFFYPEIIGGLEHKIVYYESSRGCPFACTYCISSLEPPPVYRSLEKVFAELSWFIDNGVRLVKFLDRSFNFPPERARHIWSFLISRCRDLPDKDRPCFHFELEASLLDEETTDLLLTAPPGLFQFEAGIQSIHPETLRQVRRKPLNDKAFSLLKRLVEGGRQHIHVDLIAGLPGESRALYAESYNYCWTLGADMLQAGHLKLLRGTPLMKEALRLGYRFNPYPPYEVLASDQMSAEELIEADRVADMTDRYCSRGLLPGLMPRLPELTGLSPYDLMRLLGASFAAQRGPSLRAVGKEEHYIFMKRFLEERLSVGKLSEALRLLREDYDRVRKAGSLNWETVMQKYE